jgi:hypothetical protein
VTAPAKVEPRRSAFEMFLVSQERKLHERDVSGFFSAGGTTVPKIAFWVSTKAEDDAAVAAAHAYVAKVAGESAAAKDDADLVLDAKAVEILWRVARDPADPNYPAFTSPGVMREKLSTDKIATLLNLYNEVRALEGPAPAKIDDAEVEAIAELCAKHAGTDAPDTFLAGCSRVLLTQMLVLVSVKLAEARRAAEPAEGFTSAEDAIAPLVVD